MNLITDREDSREETERDRSCSMIPFAVTFVIGLLVSYLTVTADFLTSLVDITREHKLEQLLRISTSDCLEGNG